MVQQFEEKRPEPCRIWHDPVREINEMSTAQLLSSHKRVEYATADDIQKHFVAAMNDLFCLAFLLIANADGAEDCIIRSIRGVF